MFSLLTRRSNLGAHALLRDEGVKKDGKISAACRAEVMSAVQKHLLPEFINRLDEMVIFTPLNEAQLRSIVRISMGNIQSRLEERDVAISLTDAAADLIVQLSFDPTMGARPLRRYVEKNLVTQISRMIIAESLPAHSSLEIGRAGDNFTYSVKVVPVLLCVC